MRIALLPSLWTWAALVVVATASVGGVVRWLAMAAPHRSRAEAAAALRPLGASAVLVLPYLPWVADAFPVLTVLAGPVRWVVWFVVVAESIRNIAPFVRSSDGDGIVMTSGRVALLLFVTGALLSAFAAARLTGTSLFPGGDEPHYLIMAQSLWRDGDLAIEDNHAREEYKEYYATTDVLAPHYLTRGTDGEIYSVHPVGLPVVLAPVYALGGYTAVRLLLIMVSAAVGTVLVLWLSRLGVSRSGVVFGWLAVYASAPFFLLSFAVFPEMLAGLTVVCAMRVVTRPDGQNVEWASSSLRWVGVGALAACLPWLSTKYSPMAAAIVIVALGRIWLDGNRDHVSHSHGSPIHNSVMLVLPFAVSLVAWFAFFTAFWGTPWPGAPYGGNEETHLSRLPVGISGLAIDQEYGLLPNAPVYLVAFVGLVAMWREKGRPRRLAIETGCIVVVLLCTVGAHHMWWGGTSPPGRPLVSGLPLLGLPIAWLYGRERLSSPLKNFARVLLLLSIGLTGLFLLAQNGLLLANDRDGSSSLLAYLSPLWSLPDMFPTLIGDVPAVALRTATVWLVAGGAAAWLIARARRSGFAHAVVPVGVGTATVVALSVAVPIVSPRSADLVLEARQRIGPLDRFDAGRLPIGLVYDPLRVVDVSTVPSLVSLVLEPAETGPPGDATLLYGRRLTLPLGWYDVVVELPETQDRSVAGGLAVQVGRIGFPFEQWNLSLAPRETWATSFALDVDAGYIGFQATPELEHARPTLTVRARTVVDVSRRRRIPQVVATFRTDTTSFYFFDHNVWFEPMGFWTHGGRRTQLLMVPREPPTERVTTAGLDVQCGQTLNAVEVLSDAGRETVSLDTGQSHRFLVPVFEGATLIELTTATGFTPSDMDRTSRDTRRLGCRIDAVEWIP